MSFQRFSIMLFGVVALLAVLPNFAVAQEAKDQFPQWGVFNGSPHGSNLASVCLYRDKETSGLFSRGDWKVRLENGSGVCEEKLIADLDARRLYFDFNSGYSGGKVDCTNYRKENGYSPCSSSFFANNSPYATTRDYRVLTTEFDEIVRSEAKAIAALEKLRAERIATKVAAINEANHAAYIKEFESLHSLDAIANFEKRYAWNDPDNLIKKLEPLKLQLQLQLYRERFVNAQTATKLNSFISDYELKDPDGLIPEAKQRLIIAIAAEQAEQERLNREMLDGQKRKEVEGIASRISWCNRQIAGAHKTIDREREIAQVSGYENKLLLRQAGEVIVECRSSVARDYDTYRKKGGTKSLGGLK